MFVILYSYTLSFFSRDQSSACITLPIQTHIIIHLKLIKSDIKYVKNFIFIFYISLLTIHSVSANETCGSIDIRDSHPNLKTFLSTPRDQDSMGWCYAYASADLLSIKTGKAISALDMTIVNNLAYNTGISNIFNQDKITHSGSTITKAIKATEQYGVCLEKDMPSNSNAFSDYANSTAALVENLQSLRTQILEKDLTFQQFSSSTLCNDTMKSVTKFFPKISLANVYEILKKSNWEHINSSLYRMEQKACGNKKISLSKNMEIMQVTSGWFDKDNNMFSAIDQQLSRNNAVVASYDDSIITRGGDGGAHANVIIGRQVKDGKCMYLLKNTWGPGCAYYNKNIQKDCIANEGAFWIEKEILGKTLYGVTYIK